MREDVFFASVAVEDTDNSFVPDAKKKTEITHPFTVVMECLFGMKGWIEYDTYKNALNSDAKKLRYAPPSPSVITGVETVEQQLSTVTCRLS